MAGGRTVNDLDPSAFTASVDRVVLVQWLRLKPRREIKRVVRRWGHEIGSGFGVWDTPQHSRQSRVGLPRPSRHFATHFMQVFHVQHLAEPAIRSPSPGT